MESQIAELKKALADAILDTHRTKKKWIEVDEAAGSTYEIDWSDQVRGWAKLCDLDLDARNPTDYFPY